MHAVILCHICFSQAMKIGLLNARSERSGGGMLPGGAKRSLRSSITFAFPAHSNNVVGSSTTHCQFKLGDLIGEAVHKCRYTYCTKTSRIYMLTKMIPKTIIIKQLMLQNTFINKRGRSIKEICVHTLPFCIYYIILLHRK